MPSRERFPIAWNHAIEKEPLNINKLEHVLIEKVCQLLRTCSNERRASPSEGRRLPLARGGAAR
jgi:hypothetical protein